MTDAFRTTRRAAIAGAAFAAVIPALAAEPPPPRLRPIRVGDPAAMGLNVARLIEERDAILADIKAGVIPGAVMLVGRKGQVGWLQNLGQQGPADPTPMSPTTIFRIYSMTKPIISVAIMMMVEQGKIGLDDPVSKYLPEFANTKVLVGEGVTRPATAVMTMRHLLSHTSGLIAVVGPPRTELHKIWADSKAWSDDKTVVEASRALGPLPVLADPGTLWNYGRSTDVLAAILEVVGGMAVDHVLRRSIFDPLGMDDTGFYLPPDRKGRVAEPSSGKLPDPFKRMPMMSGSSGLVSSTENYLQFTRMLIGRGQLNGARIIKPQTLDLMTTDQLSPAVSRKNFVYKNGGGFGLGFGLMPVGVGGPHASIAHTWAGAAGTDFWVDPKNDLFAILMIQSFPDGAKLRARFQTAVYEFLTR